MLPSLVQCWICCPALDTQGQVLSRLLWEQSGGGTLQRDPHRARTEHSRVWRLFIYARGQREKRPGLRNPGMGCQGSWGSRSDTVVVMSGAQSWDSGKAMGGTERPWQSCVDNGSLAMGEQGFCTSELSYLHTTTRKTFAQPLAWALSTQPLNSVYSGMVCSPHQSAVI